MDPLAQAVSLLSSSSLPPPLVRQATPAPATEPTLLGQPKEAEKNGRRKSIPRPSMVQRQDTPTTSLRLETGTRKVGYNDFTVVEAPASSGASQTIVMIKAFRSSSAGTRRWMTGPAPGLATIREDSDGDESEQNVTAASPLDSLDTELFLKPTKSPVKQMRFPKLKNKPTAAGRVGKESSTPWSKSGSAGSLTDSMTIGNGRIEIQVSD